MYIYFFNVNTNSSVIKRWKAFFWFLGMYLKQISQSLQVSYCVSVEPLCLCVWPDWELLGWFSLWRPAKGWQLASMQHLLGFHNPPLPLLSPSCLQDSALRGSYEDGKAMEDHCGKRKRTVLTLWCFWLQHVSTASFYQFKFGQISSES